MLKKFTYFSLASAGGILANTYDEDNLSPNTDHTTYYNDATSTYRVPGWLKNSNNNLNSSVLPSFLHSDPFYLFDSNSNLQKNGVWNQANQAVSLGNGFLIGEKHIGGIQDGSSTQEQIDLINAAHEAVKNRMPGGHTDANYKVKSDSDDDDTTNYIDTWNHVRNWWIRDGSLFALLMDDRANRMIHNGEWEKFQTDILIGSDQNGDQYYKVRPEEHHMEHLRTFCNQMGGDLWSPASQAEYDDLMERENSVCDKHAEVFQDGKIFGSFGTSSGRTEIYLNLHRDGYLNCPLGVSDQRSVQPVGTAGLSTKLSCPQQYKSDNNLLYLRSLTETTNTYYTTDAYFADNLNVNGMCDAPNSKIYEYAIFQRNEDFTCDSFDKPYAEENCWDINTSKFRFQKFVQNDMPLINKILGVDTNGVSQLQKDCVVATCNNDASKTGPPNDQRSKSEWNVDHCNQHRHVGFCRIRAFGCNKQDWNCVSNYHKSCGSRQYLTSSVSHWADNNVEEKINILGGKAAECDIAAAVKTTQNDQKVLFISDKDQNDVETQDWIDSLGLDASQYSVEFSDWSEKDNIGDQCSCKCWDSGSDRVQTGNANLDSCDSIETPNGVPGRHVFVASTSCLATSNDIGFNKTFTCQDDPVADCGCISGSVTATCTLSDNGYEASFILGDSSDVCVDSCCPVKDDSVFTNNNQIFTDDRTPNRQNCPLWKTGDSYTMTCNENFHISGDPTQNLNSDQKTISVEDVDNNKCFQPLNCVPNQCGCPVKSNGYCYGVNNNFEFDATVSNKEQKSAGDRIRCRCDEGYVNVRAGDRLPYDDLTCLVSGNYDGLIGTCEPVKCANPPDLMDSTNTEVIGLPDSQKPRSLENEECVVYRCKDGYEPEDPANPPKACCTKAVLPNSVDNDQNSGWMGFYGEINGTCVPSKNECRPISNDLFPNNAWNPVYIPGESQLSDCHGIYNESAIVNFNKQISDGTISTFKNGQRAVFECYDDYSAYKQDNYLETTQSISEDMSCADGSKNFDSDPCREKQTHFLVDDWIQYQSHPIATNNDKIVTICKNGEWVGFSHQCLCQEQFDRLLSEKIVDYFNVKPGFCDKMSMLRDMGDLIDEQNGNKMNDAGGSSAKVLMTTCGLVPAVLLFGN